MATDLLIIILTLGIRLLSGIFGKKND